MTTIAVQADRWLFDSTDLSTYSVIVQKVGDAEDLPGLRGDDIAVPNLPGRRWAPKLPDSRRFTLAMWVSDMDAAGTVTAPSAPEQAQANLDALRTLFARPGLRALAHVLPGGSTRTAQAEVVGVQVAEPNGGRLSHILMVDFALPDPYFYASSVVDSARAIAASPTDFTLTHPGSVRTNRVTFDFVGPISNPRVLQTTSGIYVECLVTVASAKHLIIDCERFTATNDGVLAIGSIRHSGDFRWMVIEPGAQTLRVTATSPGGTLTTTAYAPYHA